MAETRSERFARQYHSAEFVEWTKLEPCAVPNCPDSVPRQCAHNPSRGAGGTWEDVTALCGWHHHEQHLRGVGSFQDFHGIRFSETNAAHAAAWRLEMEGLSE